MPRNPSRRLLAGAVLGIAIAGPPAVADGPRVDFDSPELFKTGATLQGPTGGPVPRLADVDEDGWPDLVVSGDLKLALRNDGLKGFTGAPRPLEEGLTEVADLDVDGHVDVVVAFEFGLRAALGDGSGGFVPQSAQGHSNLLVTGIAVGDFDEDGFPDVVFTNSYNDAASAFVCIGDGAGGFSAPGVVETGALAFGDVGAADIDQDGHLDLVASAADDSETVAGFFLVRGDGAGGFLAPTLIVDGPRPYAQSIFLGYPIVIADIDGDGLDDVSGVHGPSDTLFFALALGGGAFGPVRTVSLSAGSPVSLAVADLNADTNSDLVVTGLDSSEVLLGDGALGFTSSAAIDVRGMRSLAIADFDRDGNADIAAGHEDGVVAVYYGDGDGTFSSSDPPGHPVEPMLSGSWQALADVDDDGDLDLVFLADPEEDSDAALSVHAGDGAGGFAPLATSPVAAGTARGLALGDFDEDGLVDAVVSFSAGPQRCVVYRGDGAGAFLPGTVVTDGFAAYGLRVDDLDSDGHLDAVMGNDREDGSNWREVTILYGDGAGGFSQRLVRQVISDAIPRHLASGDFNRDGHVDVAIVTTNSLGGPRVHIFRGGGGRDFPTQYWFTTRFSPGALSTNDLDDDGDLDFSVVAGSGVSLFRNNGTGQFVESFWSNIFPVFGQVSTADMNEDGIVDVVAATTTGVVVGTCDVNCRFSSIRHFSPVDAMAASVGDVDSDGHSDVIVHDRSFVRARVVRNGSAFRLPDVLAGTVNAMGEGGIEPVLIINGGIGAGTFRRLEIDRTASFQMRMRAPSAMGGGPARFALFATIGWPDECTILPVPGGYGPIAFHPTRARKRWNNTGDSAFGAADLPSSPAPSIVLRRQNGLKKRIRVTLQGVIQDPASPSGVYAVTNGILLDSR